MVYKSRNDFYWSRVDETCDDCPIKNKRPRNRNDSVVTSHLVTPVAVCYPSVSAHSVKPKASQVQATTLSKSLR